MQVLLFPEDIIGNPPSDAPVYAVVVDESTPTAVASLLSSPRGTRVRIPREVIAAREVDEEEHANGAPGEWLRKSVVGVAGDRYVYGQVVAHTTRAVTIRGRDKEHVCPAVDVSEVAPVICFLLSNSTLRQSTVTFDRLNEHHHLILDRLMGDNDAAATKSIPRLLQGIIPSRQHPRGTDSLPWVNALSGTESLVSTRHAIDFAHYVDGGRQIPPSIRHKIGSRFDADPAHAASTTDTARPTNAPAPSDHAESEDDALLDLLNAVEPAAPSSLPRRVAATGPTATSPGDLTAKILAAIADDATLVRFYMSQLHEAAATKRGATQPPAAEPTAQRQRLVAPSDLLYTNDAAEASRSKHAFRPTHSQRAIQGLIVSPDHAGKSPVELLDSMISSRATKFKPHPAILSRVFDFQFGLRGLSIMHFDRFDLTARRRWYAEGGVNMNNFSISVDLPRARKARMLSDLADALAVLLVFAEEFMDQNARRLLSAAKEFVEDIREYGHWSEQDVESIVYWFDNVLEDFRRAVEYDISHGTATRASVKDKFSMQDPNLQSMLYVMQSEKLASLRPGSSTPSSTRSALPEASPRPDTNRRVEIRHNRATPREVLDAIPRQGRATLCLKHLSAQGCASKSPDRCSFPYRAHFIPAVLPSVVRAHIVENLGGLRADIRL